MKRSNSHRRRVRAGSSGGSSNTTMARRSSSSTSNTTVRRPRPRSMSKPNAGPSTMTDTGRRTVIAGPKPSGTAEGHTRRVRRATIAGIDVLVVSHSLDTRSDISTITTHIGMNIPAVPLGDVRSLIEAARGQDYDLIAIDEAQFFGLDLVSAVEDLLGDGIDVIVEGLCVTFDGAPFEPLPSFMAVAEEVLRLTAVCTVCGRDAVFQQRLDSGQPGT